MFVIVFVTIGGMVAVAHTDLPERHHHRVGLPAGRAVRHLRGRRLVARRTGAAAVPLRGVLAGLREVPGAQGAGYFLSTLFLLLGVQSMYQKFYAAKSPAEAKKAVAIWIVGTIVVETIVICIAVYASAYNIEHQMGWSGRSLVLNAARYMVPTPVGVLLLGRRLRRRALDGHELPAVVELQRHP